MANPPGIVTLLSDFGLCDGYVAAMKGVILREAPGATVVDAGHDVPPQDVRGGAWVLSQYWASYPAGTVHVAVVDPGVGTRRRALLARADGHFFLAPDNGLLSWVERRAAGFRAGAIRPGVHAPGGLSNTFHGRDLFAHAAGLLVSGRQEAADLAEEVDGVVRGSWVSPERSGEWVRGEIVHIDRFGNAITNISAEDVATAGHRPRVEARSYFMSRIRSTYGDVEPGEKLALINSSGMLEIAVCCGSAEQRLDLKRGDPVTVSPRRDETGEAPAPGRREESG